MGQARRLAKFGDFHFEIGLLIGIVDDQNRNAELFQSEQVFDTVGRLKKPPRKSPRFASDTPDENHRR